MNRHKIHFETLQEALSLYCHCKAQEVLLANSAEGKSHYYGIVVLAPWEGTVGEPLVFEKSTQAQNSAQEKHQTLVDQAEKAEEAAQQANEWKEKAIFTILEARANTVCTKEQQVLPI